MRTLILEHPRLPSPLHFNDIANTPLGSCLMAGYTCAALREHGHDAEILDGRHLTFAETEETILERQPGLLLVHAVYFWEHTPLLFELLKSLIIKEFPGSIILFGFSLPSAGSIFWPPFPRWTGSWSANPN